MHQLLPPPLPDGSPQIGWAKVQEIRRHVEYFRKSGKFTIVTMKQGGEKEYYLASAFEVCNGFGFISSLSIDAALQHCRAAW